MKTLIFTFWIAFLPMAIFAQEDSTMASPQRPIGMTVDQFNMKLKITTKPLLIDFTADWCVVCKRQKPVLDQVMAEVKDQAELMVIDMESNPLVAAYFEVDGLPVIILYKDGDMIWNGEGFQDKMQILEQVSPFIYSEEHRRKQSN